MIWGILFSYVHQISGLGMPWKKRNSEIWLLKFLQYFNTYFSVLLEEQNIHFMCRLSYILTSFAMTRIMRFILCVTGGTFWVVLFYLTEHIHKQSRSKWKAMEGIFNQIRELQLKWQWVQENSMVRRCIWDFKIKNPQSFSGNVFNFIAVSAELDNLFCGLYMSLK